MFHTQHPQTEAAQSETSNLVVQAFTKFGSFHGFGIETPPKPQALMQGLGLSLSMITPITPDSFLQNKRQNKQIPSSEKLAT